MRLKPLATLLLATLAILSPRAPAQTAAPDEPAPLVVHGRQVAVFRSRLAGYPPKDRAPSAADRIRRALEADGPGVVAVREIPEGRLFEIDGRALFVLTSGDANTLEGESLESVTAETTARLKTVIEESREGRDVKRLFGAVALAALATVLLGGALLGLSRLRRRLERALDGALEKRLERMKRSGGDAVPREHLSGLLRAGVRVAVLVVGTVVVVTWLEFVLHRFPFTRPVGERFAGLLRDALGTVGSAILGMIPGLLVVVIIFFLTRFLARLLEGVFRRIETGEVEVTWLERDLAAPTRRIAVALLWVFAIVMSYPYLPGSGSEAFKGISVLVGLMISLGSTSLVGQAASGLMLLYSRTVRVGEWVRIGEHEGLVTGVGMLATRLKTGLGDEKILPNNVVVATTTHNFSRFALGRGHLVEASVTIGYGEPWRQVEALLLRAAERTSDIRKEPRPFVIQRALSDFYVEYQLNAYTDESTRRLLVLSELHRNIQDAFNEFGVQIMSPHYFGDPAHPVVVPKEKWHLPPAPTPAGKPPEG